MGLPGEYDDVRGAGAHPASGVVAVGIDLVSVPRFAAAMSRTPPLADRLFVDAERVTVSGRERSAASLAARFAAKEAVAKALGAPRGLAWHDCEVRQGPDGRPVLAIRGTVAAASARHGIARWELSLTHDAGLAAATVLALA